jgi:hypothetical protein
MLKTTKVGRRDVLTGGLMGLAGALGMAVAGPTPARAAPVTQLSDAELLVALQNVFWTSAQAPHDKSFYVVATPWCGVCKYLYGKFRDKTGFQARFILTAPHTDEDRKLIAYTILSQSGKGLDAMYASRRAPEVLGTETARDFVVGVNTAAEIALKDALTTRLVRGTYGFPILVFNVGGRVLTLAGAPDADPFLALAEARAGSSGEISGAAPFLANPPVITEASGAAGARRAGVGVHVAPLAGSARLRVLNPGEGLPIAGHTTVGGRKWLALQAFKKGGPYGYGLAEDFGQ